MYYVVLTFYSYSHGLRDISSVIPSITYVGAHVVCCNIVDDKKGHSIFIFLFHILSLVIIPEIVGSWVAHGAALQPQIRANINFRVL